MNDKNPKSDVTPDKSAGRRKRAAPTIDLEAREIPPAAESETAEPDAVSPQQPEEMSQAAAPEDDRTERAASKSALGSSASFGGVTEESDSAPPVDGATTPPQSGVKPFIVGGIAGAAAAVLVIAGGWYAGLFAGNEATVPDPRVAALESQIKELQSRPAAAATNTGATDALDGRIAKVETDVAKLASAPPPAAAPANDDALKSLGVALAALNRRYDELGATVREAQTRAAAAEKAASDMRASLQAVSKTAAAGASSSDFASLQQRLSALEEQSKAARADLAKATESDKAARLALSAAAVRDAVLRGTPFAEELAQAKALGADEQALAPLWPLAASGVPTVKVLAKQLNDLLPKLKTAAGSPASSGGFLERLQANAGNLVRVRPTGSPAGDDASAVLARIEASAAQENIAAALTDIGALPEAARNVAAGWVTRATARQKALDAARDFAASSTLALGSK